MNPESLIAALTAEVRQMRHDINLLIEKSPESVSPWIPPRELARLLGVSSQDNDRDDHGAAKKGQIRVTVHGGLT